MGREGAAGVISPSNFVSRPGFTAHRPSTIFDPGDTKLPGIFEVPS